MSNIKFGTGGWRAVIGDGFTKANVQLLTAALARKLDPQQVNYVEIGCGSGGARFLRTALDAMEEENCQIYQATAPALA